VGVKTRLFVHLAALVSLAACHHGDSRPSVLPIPLEIAATSDVHPTHYANSITVYLEPVADERDDKTRVGVNRQEQPEVPVTSPGKQPGDFVSAILTTELTNRGVKIVPDAASAERVLRIHLKQFFAEETPDYKADVSVLAEVIDPKQQVLLSTLFGGAAKQWGRSLAQDNYDEVLSRATLDLAKTMLEQPDFVKAMGAGSAGAPAGPTPAHDVHVDVHVN
jgi:hypothetical protein